MLFPLLLSPRVCTGAQGWAGDLADPVQVHQEDFSVCPCCLVKLQAEM